MKNKRLKSIDHIINDICQKENIPRSYILENLQKYSDKYKLNLSIKEQHELKNKKTLNYFRTLQKAPKLTPYS